MRLILNGINGDYLRNITEVAAPETDRVDAAVAYATDAALLFDWCWENKIVLRYWGRFDETIPVGVPILKSFLDRRSPNFTCKLVRRFHAKVIWWRGYGAYIGSANMTQSAWWSNIEAGLFIPDTELSATGHDLQLEEFFRIVDRHASPLTDELFRAIQRRAQAIQATTSRDRPDATSFIGNLHVQPFDGLSYSSNANAADVQRADFLKEWNGTLQLLRDIGNRVSEPGNRPVWINSDVPRGAQADQFLHAHYYQRTFENRHAMFETHFARNRDNPDAAVRDAFEWWRGLPAPPGSEAVTLNEWGPFLREKLSRDQVLLLSEQDLIDVFSRVHAIRDHARRVANAELNLPGDRRYSIEEKSEALARHVYQRRSANGDSVQRLLSRILHEGPKDELAERLWEAVANPAMKIDHVGISALGELVGWAFPNEFPPSNGRTSKALRSLGYDVTVHVT